MCSRHTRHHTGLRWGCLPTGLSSVKLVTYRLNWNIELTRQSSKAIWSMTKPIKRGNSSCRNWKNSSWKHMRTPRFTRKNPEEGLPSRLESTLVQFQIKAHCRSSAESGRDGEHLTNGTSHMERKRQYINPRGKVITSLKPEKPLSTSTLGISGALELFWE
ncbi:hypothetical protein CR513_34750, partial [Mucuna pruriens]